MSEGNGSGSNASINEMPTEILLQIFSYLPPETTAYVVPRVCWRWRKLYADPSLYRDLQFTGKEPSTRKIIFILTTFAKDIKSLTLKQQAAGNELLRAVGCYNKKLISLKVIDCMGDAYNSFISAPNMLRIVTKCTALQELRFKDTRTSCGPKFFKRLSNLRQLTNFQLGSLRYMSCNFAVENVPTVASNVKEQRLEHLRLSHGKRDRFSLVGLSNEPVLTLTDKHKTTLKTLKINCSQLTNESMSVIAACKQLSSLGLQYLHRVDNRGIHHLGELNMTRLGISYNCKVTAEAWTRLFLRDRMRVLVKLKLVRCKYVDDSVLTAIGENLKSLKLLRIVRCKRVTNEGRRKIRKLLPSCRVICVPSMQRQT